MAELTSVSRESARHGRATPGASDFLREVYLESHEHTRVVLRDLAQRLGVSAPAVSRMAQRLVRKGYVKREGACGFVLSDSGRRVALKSLRKMRIFEVFLVKELGYTWDEVFPLTVQSSHHIDDEVIERMFLKLNKPRRCPHGDPIPTRDGKIEYPVTRKLSELESGKAGVVGHVSTHDPEMLRYLATLGLVPGMPVNVVSRAPFGGPIRVRVKSSDPRQLFENEHVIGAELAGVIAVESA